MIEINPRLVFLLAFLAAIALYVWRDKKLERHSLLFIGRTKKGILTIDRIAKKAPRFWKYYGWAGVATGLLSIVVAFIGIIYTFFDMVSTQSAENGPALFLPGTGSETQVQAGITFVPAEYWIIAVFVIMTVHELSHGIVARAEDIEIKSVGWIILGILPLGAFVEPEGEKMLPGSEGDGKESKATWDVGDWKSRLKVLCAGSFANYLTAALFFLLAIGFTAAVTYEESSSYIGVHLGQQNDSIFYQAQEGYPAYEAGMRNGTLISIDGNEINTPEDIREFSNSLEPNQTIEVKTSEDTFTVTATENTMPQYKEGIAPYSGYLNWFISMLMTVSFFNFVVGLFNMLPFKPLDGGLSAETLIKEYWGEDKIEYLNKFSLMGLALLISMLAAAIIGI